jgi:transcriptional regulator of acetoin/glycerol metabolism
VLRTAAVMSAGERSITTAHLSDDFLEEARSPAPLSNTAPHRPAASAASVADTVMPDAMDAAGSLGRTAAAGWPASGTAHRGGGNDSDNTEHPEPGGLGERAPRHALPPAEPLPARTLEEAETELIRSTLQALGGNISAASKQLGISRNTIYRKLRWNNAPGSA